MATVHLLISGKVQGVFYRATAKKVAKQLQISGWIKNTSKGHVEALITGEAESLKKFIVWCRMGPDKAEVEKVEVENREATSFEDFTILRF